jgi:RsiW-degrading membrane proteinase PrsW (M82 family)
MEAFLLVLAVAMAPVIFIFSLVYFLDRHDREPLKMLIITFILGILTAIPAVFLEVYLGKTLKVSPGVNAFETFVYAMVVVAASEEGVKFLSVRLFAYRSKHFDEPYDGIMYCVAASLGFAAIENLGYVMEFGTGTGVLRMFTAVPGHAMMGVVMGYFMGLAKYREHKAHGARTLLIGLLAAMLIHGLYDFFLMWNQDYVALLAFVVLIIALVLSIRAIRIHKRNSPHKPVAPEGNVQ